MITIHLTLIGNKWVRRAQVSLSVGGSRVVVAVNTCVLDPRANTACVYMVALGRRQKNTSTRMTEWPSISHASQALTSPGGDLSVYWGFPWT